MNHKGKTLEQFKKEAKEIHGDNYSYDEFVYINNKTKGIIICNKCGNKFEMIPTNHICKKQSCPYCNGTVKYTTDEWIEKAKQIHGDKYDYSESKYINGDTKIKIICHEKDEFGNEHGEFWQMPRKHINEKQGCPKCSPNVPITFKIFEKKAIDKHGNKYKYHEHEYNGYNKETLITCPVHGDFKQRPSLHMNGYGCPECAKVIRASKKVISFEEFVRRARETHGDNFIYNEEKYINYTTPTEIICKKHGPFMQRPDKHIDRGHGCRKCSLEKQSERQLLNKDEFLKRSIDVHGDKYSYDEFVYKGNNVKGIIICKKHGKFLQTPNKHWLGQGCPKCNQSHLENEIEIMLKKSGLDYIYQATKKNLDFIGMKSIDFYIPSLKIGIECQGIQHFEDVKFMKSEKVQKSDIDKFLMCEENGIKIIYYTNLIDKTQKNDFYKNKMVFNDINNLLKYITSYETSN